MQVQYYQPGQIHNFRENPQFIVNKPIINQTIPLYRSPGIPVYSGIPPASPVKFIGNNDYAEYSTRRIEPPVFKHANKYRKIRD